MDFYSFLKEFHSGWAYLVVVLTLVMLIIGIYHFATKKPIHRMIRKISFYTVLSYHIQFLIGVVLYIVSPRIEGFWASGEAMSNSDQRLLVLEHPLMMFTAVILMTIANVKLKKNEYVKTSYIIFLVLAALCFYMIPWTQWLAS